MRHPIIVTALLLVTPAVAAAQQNLSREGTTGLAIEAIRPSIKDQDMSIISAAYFVSAHHELRPGTRLLVELPLAYSSVRSSDGAPALSGGITGNPYVGLEFVRTKTTFDVGVRAPIGSDPDFATFVGTSADLDRLEAFLPDIMTVRAGVDVHSVSPTGMAYGVQVAPVAWIPTGDSSDEDVDLLLSYGATVGYRGPTARLAARLAGRAMVTEDDLDFAQRTLHQAVFSGDFG